VWRARYLGWGAPPSAAPPPPGNFGLGVLVLFGHKFTMTSVESAEGRLRLPPVNVKTIRCQGRKSCSGSTPTAHAPFLDTPDATLRESLDGHTRSGSVTSAPTGFRRAP